ncbi:hypothetical protein NLG97_g5466 [Lecanicillium saksenae]|uniref:Uncharacterized protein n=1 Tax=Lecanicillium saksenae TaxID=468837 RepID=A0ACC1QSD7_9HYPO|nr:hypothetical protein NLG97_g5466 [Lecanicillium saksenae]
MKFQYLAIAASLATRVAAGGYHGCLERVALWQAYTLEGKSGTKSPTLGFHCPRFQAETGCPDDDWRVCGVPGQRCSFSQLMKQLNPGAYGDEPLGWLVVDPQHQNRVDVKKTAGNCYTHFQKLDRPVPDFAPQNAMKFATTNFGDYVVALGRRMDALWGGLMPMTKIGQGPEYKAFTETSKDIAKIRRADVGSYLIPEARAALEPEITVITKDLGEHPFLHHNMETVDWIATEEKAAKDGVEDYEEKITTFKNDYFGAGTAAGGHQNINDKYGEVETKRQKCGRK